MSQSDFDSLYLVSGQLVCLFDKEGRFEKAGTEWTNLLGWSQEELIGHNYREFLHPDDIAPSDEAVENHYETGHYEKLFVNRYRKKDGKYVWLQWDGVLLRDEKLFSIARDYTYFKEQESFFNAIEETLNIGSFRSNLDTGDHSGSKGIYKIYDADPAHPLVTEKAFLNFPQPGQDILRKKVERLISDGEGYCVELPFISENGTQKHIRCMGRFSKYKGNREIFGTMQDITSEVIKQREMDQQRAQVINNSKMAALGEMAANIAHEINNPLSLILGKAEYIASKMDNGTVPTEEIKETFLQIKKTSERIAKTINSLRSYSKSNAGLDPQAFSIQMIIDETLELCHERLKRLGVQVFVDDVPDVEVTTYGTQLSQVFLNLINNSVEATEGLKKRWIKISGKVENKEVVISVSDSGAGISSAVKPRIFEPFFTTKGMDGTGLGLCISKTIVGQHKGKIRYVPEQKTTTFEVTLPLV